jgi:hypothetical protein
LLSLPPSLSLFDGTLTRSLNQSARASWYTNKFLKGDIRQECEEVWQTYQECLKKHSSNLFPDLILNGSAKKETKM